METCARCGMTREAIVDTGLDCDAAYAIQQRKDAHRGHDIIDDGDRLMLRRKSASLKNTDRKTA